MPSAPPTTKEATIQATGPGPHGVPLCGVAELDEANYAEDYGNTRSRSFPDRTRPHLSRYQQPDDRSPYDDVYEGVVRHGSDQLAGARPSAPSSGLTE